MLCEQMFVFASREDLTLSGWFRYGFNPCSTLAIEYMDTAQRVAVTTTLSAAAGGAFTLSLHVLLGNPPDVAPALNGILAGLVSITAACPVVQPWAAVIIGMLAAPVYIASSLALKRLEIDDPLDAAPVHFFCGMWGVLAVGLFADKELTAGAYGTYLEGYGVFMGGDGVQLGVQMLAVVVIGAWSCTTSALMFAALKYANILRVSIDDEVTGLDMTHHGGSAYTFSKEGALQRARLSHRRADMRVCTVVLEGDQVDCSPQISLLRAGCSVYNMQVCFLSCLEEFQAFLGGGIIPYTEICNFLQ